MTAILVGARLLLLAEGHTFRTCYLDIFYEACPDDLNYVRGTFVRIPILKKERPEDQRRVDKTCQFAGRPVCVREEWIFRKNCRL